MGIMHTKSNLINSAVNIIKKEWDGPICAYPDSGFFRMPEWVFEEIITPKRFASYAKKWYENGVRIIGGCCGLGVEHIQELNKLRKNL